MNVSATIRRAPGLLALALAAVITVLLPTQLLAADPSAAPDSGASPLASMTPAEAMCDSASDLRIIIGFLRDTDVSEDGWAPLLVGAIAGLAEARGLAGEAGETYRPLVEDLIASLEGLRSTIDELSGLDTIGSQVAVIGEAITGIGNAMDALSVALQAPCPTDGAPAPEASASPAS